MRFLLFLHFRMIGNVRESFFENRKVCDWLKKVFQLHLNSTFL